MSSSATIHDVIPIRETQHYWGLHPHDNVTVGTGGKVVFRTAVGFHDIAVVTAEQWDACDVSNAEMWVNVMGDLQVDGAGTVKKTEPFYEFTYNADTPGTYYVVCTVGAGGHCNTGQKTVVTVTEDTSNEVVPVMGSAVPFWTVGVGYANITIDLGDSVRFVSDSEGYHDVALLDTSVCGAFNNYECCTTYEITPAIETSLYSQDDFKANQEYIWTPDSTGYHEVVCAVSAGGHCAFGQRFGLTVKPPAMEKPAEASPNADALASSAAGLHSSIAVVALLLAMLF